MIHLTQADYLAQPWPNGRGRTIQLVRVDGADGGLMWRLSVASVVEDGPFSIFPEVERNLTVISGPGFDLTGGVNLRCVPLVPVAFPGDVAVSASGVRAACEDFNVMTARGLPLPDVQVVTGGMVVPPTGGFVCCFALTQCRIAATQVAAHDLLVSRTAVEVRAGTGLTVRFSADYLWPGTQDGGAEESSHI
jgi:uncharacterized protein